MMFDLSTIALDDVDLPEGPRAWVGHVPFALWLVEQARPDMLVELGTHYGLSYFSFCSGVISAGLQTKCFAVDTWQGDEHAGIYGEEVYAKVDDRNRRAFHAFSSLLRMTFDKAATQFADSTIDLLHIDGLHTYEAVKHDFDTWRPKLSSRGIVLFHDTNVRERDFGVWRLWEELSRAYPHFEFQHSNGLGVLFLGDTQPEALQALYREGGDVEKVLFKRLFARLGQSLELQAQLRIRLTEMDELRRMTAEAQQQVTSAREGQEAAQREAASARAQQAAARVAHEAAQRQEMDRVREEAEVRLRMAVDARDAKSAALEAELSAVLHSSSWRISAPYRWLGRGVYRLHAGVRLLPLATRQAGGIIPFVRTGVRVLSAEGLPGVRRRARSLAEHEGDPPGRADDGR